MVNLGFTELYIPPIYRGTRQHILMIMFFYSNEIKKGSPQKWNVSLSYNSPKLNKIFEKTLNEYNTTAFLVVKDDSIRFEKYWNGYSSKKLSNSFSVTKSIVGLLVGVAIKEKKKLKASMIRCVITFLNSVKKKDLKFL